MEKEKIYAFIDSQNLNMSIRDQGWKLDFNKFYIYLKDKFKIDKVFLFIGYVDKNISLYKELEHIGYVLIFKPTIFSKSNMIKGNIDAELVLHSMIEFSNYTKAIIVSGDGDFYCLIDYLLYKDKFFKLIIPNKQKYSSLLRRFLGAVLFLSESNLKNKLEK